ncbi:MAG TPA: SDR family NAD(P)-dependent oxidoreductase [Desulfopila sp.]|nr:SDR family NAD(P)-dependent oxidoreductase [Desulfopila sp.]
MKILITGATSGIGRQLALDYHGEGHEVFAVGRNKEALDELAGKGLHTGRVDLTNRTQSLEWFAGLDSMDLAILNAGTCEYIDLPNFDSALVSRVMRTNVESLAISIEGVLPLLRKGTRPHLVGVGSSAAYLHLPRAEAYGGSKAAVAYIIDTLRISLQTESIDVSLVCPGFVKTPLTDKNDFNMVSLISTADASRYMRRGIARRKREIHFPRKFTWTMKLLSCLPRAVWEKIASRMVG